MTDCIHGAFDYGELARLGLQPEEILDFSVNGNPYGLSPHVHKAIANVPVDRYPDRECLVLRQTILDVELAAANLSLASIICGNGSSELIWAIAHAYLVVGRQSCYHRSHIWRVSSGFSCGWSLCGRGLCRS